MSPRQAGVQAIGGATEQARATADQFELWDTFKDWLYHAAGAAAAVVPYLLAAGARVGKAIDIDDNDPGC